MKSFLDSAKVKYIFKKNCFSFNMHLKGSEQNLSFIISVTECAYDASVVLEDISVNQEKLPAVLEYIQRVNDKFFHASFGVYEDLVMCSQYANCNGITPNHDFIKEMIKWIVVCIELYGSGIIDLLSDKGNPKEIFDKYDKEVYDE